MADSIEPDALVGVLGGGQLGAMFATAARRLGYRIAVWDPDPDAPALRLADLPVNAPLTDQASLVAFLDSVRVATYEWENIPASVCEAIEQRVPVRPATRILKILQDRLEQKTFLAGRGFPVTPFRAVPTPDDLVVPEEIGFPCLCKTATAGYDGKGQWRLAEPADVPTVREQLSGQSQPRWILERFLSFEKELSVLVVRSAGGDRRIYPLVENLHETGILRVTRVPAGIDSETTARAVDLAGAVVEALDGVGVFCVELFLMPHGLLFINEVAPRPHNSGHYTLDACTISQFEQQVRAVCALPLGEVRLLCPAVMVNLIGEDLIRAGSGNGLVQLLRTPGATLHNYGKRSIRPGRKMGHVTFLAREPQAAWEAASALRKQLAGPALPEAALPQRV